ncbi:DUF397 domain-containing protein [Streptomyces sp. NPDC050448]|uniref:DUF397 domain-containing protein n=1 Tax=Streptomyces sp. NPDC050448 TaxID=3155404 RepID=UPI00344A858A
MRRLRGRAETVCVEVAACASAVHVRDSKDVTRPAFTVAPTAWAAFTAYARS